ncbi:MAG TPA: SpoIIE family protein phosphatase [Solirubrobacter sp.]|nr:SpoIIE family protein phosphatase [Solirubrobacter sp.]
MAGHGKGRLAARTGARRPGIARWLALALALQAALAAVDLYVPNDVQFTSTYVLAPFALAVAGNTRATAGVALLAVALAIASGFWNDYAGSADHLLRVTIVTAGGGLATLAAWALERAAEQRARMAVLAAIGHLSGAETVDAAVEGLAEALVPAVGDTCWVDLEEADGQTRRLFEHGGTQAPEPPEHATTPQLAQDNTQAKVPLDDFGTLGLATRADHYDDDDLAFLQVLAGRVALVLRNARLVTSLRSTQARLDGVLGSLAEAVTVHDDHGQTIYANEAAARLLGRPTAQDVTTAAPGELAARFSIVKEDGTPVALTDLPGRRLVKGEPAPSLLTRSIDRTTGRGYWLLTKATLLEDEGRAYAVNIIEDVTEAKEAELRQRFLAQAGQLLASSLDYQQTLQRVAQLAVPWLADWCAIDMPDEHGRIEQVALAHTDPAKVAMAAELRRSYPPDPHAATGVPGILKGGPPELIKDIPDELLERAVQDSEQQQGLKAIGMRSVMLLPMRVGDETLGALTLVSADSGRRFSDDDFVFAQDLALRAATAIQNARLYEAQARVAHTLQSSLLPERLPELPGWGGAASYQAGEQGAEVGGDFYDIVAADGGRHLVFLGDVTGKGIEAAALTSLVRHSVRTAARFDPRPAAVLTLVNEILVEQPRLAPVTLVCVLIEGSRMIVAAAGHPPPLLRRAGKVVEVGPTGVLLGAIGDQTFREEVVEIRPGDTVLLYTDGVTDTPGADERFGPERLSQILNDAPAQPTGILERIEAALREFQAGTATDDRAMLVLRFGGEHDAALGLRPAA